MARYRKFFRKKMRRIQVFVLALAVMLVLLAAFLAFKFLALDAKNKYLIKSNHYAFKVATPKNWIGEENTLYSAENINQILNKCKNNKDNNYEIGAFRFKDQKYPDKFGEMGYFPETAKTGAILEIAIYCVPDSFQNKALWQSYADDLEVAGEKVFEGFMNLIGFGKTKYVFFTHGNFQYRVNEYVYVSPSDKNKNETAIKNNYYKVFNQIVSSISFVQ